MEDSKIHLISRILKLKQKNLKKTQGIHSLSTSKKSNHKKDASLLQKGTEFEAFVVKRFNTNYFTLIEWRSDKDTEGIFPLMSRFPDLEFHYESQTECIQFAVECKWREYFFEDGITFKEFQLDNYRLYESVTGNHTFIVIGIGNTPSHPRNVYILPLKEIKQNKLHEFELNVYRRKQPHDKFFIDCQRKRLQ
jgi:hypothetical protein